MIDNKINFIMNNQTDNSSLPIWIWILALLTGWIGVALALVQFFINKNKAPRRAKQALILTITCAICTIIPQIVIYRLM